MWSTGLTFKKWTQTRVSNGRAYLLRRLWVTHGLADGEEFEGVPISTEKKGQRAEPPAKAEGEEVPNSEKKKGKRAEPPAKVEGTDQSSKLSAPKNTARAARRTGIDWLSVDSAICASIV